MACGDKYKTRFTATNWNTAGPWSKPRTWDDPWFGAPGPLDYRAWKATAERATDAMWEALELLGQIENDLGRGFPKYNEYNDGAAAVYNRRNGLPFFISLDYQGPAEEAVAIVKDAACQLEYLNAAIEGYGRKPTTSPGDKSKPESSWLDKLIPWAIVGTVAVGAWYIDKKDGDG